ncbi:hypothetical protein [Paenibacillus sp.]|uniref:hypothetical protein n=1 Tax=Paenibacillus sp. TaxID=58172 RepID=UPI0028AB82F9|nr:hypothetical protein [Paenibacillus sp.]
MNKIDNEIQRDIVIFLFKYETTSCCFTLLNYRSPLAMHAAQERAAPQRMKMDTSVYTVCTAGEEGR